MKNSGYTIWPRLEVLDLVLSQFVLPSNLLTHESVQNIIKLQNPDGRVSFDRWLMVAKDFGWNDSCSRLWWDLLLVAVSYTQKSEKEPKAEDYDIELSYILIFLILHVDDAAPVKSDSLGPLYDTHWPSSEDAMISSSLSTEALSPSSYSSARGPAVPLLPGSPKSPRSPRKSPTSVSPTKRVNTSLQRQSWTPAQHLLFLKQKLPLILIAISIEDQLFDPELKESFPSLDKLSGITLEGFSRDDIQVPEAAFSYLKLVLCGGYDEEHECELSLAINEWWRTNEDTKESTLTIVNAPCAGGLSTFTGPIGGRKASASLVDIVRAINAVLELNEVVYAAPTSICPTGRKGRSGSSSEKSSLFNTGSSTSDRDGSALLQEPSRLEYPLAALTKFKPTAVSNCSTTVLQIAVAPNNSSSCTFTRSEELAVGSTDSSECFDLLSNRMSSSSLLSAALEVEEDPADDPGGRSWKGLPYLHVSGCQAAFIYLLSAFTAGHISNCFDSEIVLGAVAGTLVVVGCARVCISCVCRRLLVINCVNCEFNIACTSPSVVGGESKGLTFGPYNCSYRSLGAHARAASLHGLVVRGAFNEAVVTGHKEEEAGKVEEQERKRNEEEVEGAGRARETEINLWSHFCGVTACLEQSPSIGSPSGYAIDAAGTPSAVALPSPALSVACILAPEKFRYVTVPLVQENLPLERCAIILPDAYADEFISRTKRVATLRSSVKSQEEDASAGTDMKDGRTASVSKQVAARNEMTTAFLDWLTATGKSQQLVDLIKLESVG